MQLSSPTRLWHAAWLALGALTLPGQAAQAAPMFDVQAMALPAGETDCRHIGFTDAQWIVIDCTAPVTLYNTGYHRTPAGPWVQIPAPAHSEYNELAAANNAGVVTGAHRWDNKTGNVAYTWSVAGGYRYLSDAANGWLEVRDINDLGQVVGKEGSNATVWNADGSVAYRDPSHYGFYSFSSAVEINNDGVVVWTSTGRGNGLWTAEGGVQTVRVNGRRLVMGTLNNVGQGMGGYLVSSKTQLVAMMRNGATPILVGEPRHNVYPVSMNDAGQATYETNSVDGATAYYWDEQSGDHDLLTLVNPGSPLAGRMAVHGGGTLNNVGQILVTGHDVLTGEGQIYLFTPMTN